MIPREIRTRRTPVARAVRISTRYHPKVTRAGAGRDATEMAKRARPSARTSVNMWPASASRARLLERIPPAISAIMTTAVSAIVQVRLRRSAERYTWLCRCSSPAGWPAPRPSDKDDDGDRMRVGMGHGQVARADAQLRRQLLRAAGQPDGGWAVGARDLDVAPQPSEAGGHSQRLDDRFLGRESRREMARGRSPARRIRRLGL